MIVVVASVILVITTKIRLNVIQMMKITVNGYGDNNVMLLLTMVTTILTTVMLTIMLTITMMWTVMTVLMTLTRTPTGS